MNPPADELLQQSIDRFWETVPPVWNAVRSQVRALATEHFDITVEQFHVLRHLRRGASSVSELAEIGRISRPAISQGVEALVQKGLIDRRRDRDDRRFVHLELTPAGAALLDEIFGRARAWMRSRLSTLSAADLEAINAALPLLRMAYEDRDEG